MNIFSYPVAKNELTDIICRGDQVRIERIVSTGQTSAPGFWYQQVEDEWVLLVQGEAILTFTDYELKMKAGDTVFIPAGIKHRVDYTSAKPACVWICAFGCLKAEEN